MLGKAFPEGVDQFSRVDRIQVDFAPTAPAPVTVTVAVRDAQGGQYAQRLTVGDRQKTIYLPFADIKAANVQLNALKSIEFSADRPGAVMVDDLRLVRAGGGISLSAPNFGKSISNRQPVWETMLPFPEKYRVIEYLRPAIHLAVGAAHRHLLRHPGPTRSAINSSDLAPTSAWPLPTFFSPS